MFYHDITPEYLSNQGINPEGLTFGPNFLPYNSRLKQYSRDLRKGHQIAEVKMWKCLRAKNKGYAFRRQYLQVQERLTTQIKNAINDALHPLGVAVVIEAQHMCMSMRGVQKQSAVTTTSDFIGAFERESTREEFFQLIGSNLHK